MLWPLIAAQNGTKFDSPCEIYMHLHHPNFRGISRTVQQLSEWERLERVRHLPVSLLCLQGIVRCEECWAQLSHKPSFTLILRSYPLLLQVSHSGGITNSIGGEYGVGGAEQCRHRAFAACGDGCTRVCGHPIVESCESLCHRLGDVNI
jgi:hypothetical protein